MKVKFGATIVLQCSGELFVDKVSDHVNVYIAPELHVLPLIVTGGGEQLEDLNDPDTAKLAKQAVVHAALQMATKGTAPTTGVVESSGPMGNPDKGARS